MPVHRRTDRHDAAAHSIRHNIPVGAAIFTDEQRGIGAFFSQPCIGPAEGHAEINGASAVFTDSGAEGAISRRGGFFPVIATVFAPIGAFATGSDNHPFVLYAWKN